MNTKLTIHLPRRLLNNAKQYAKSHRTTLTALITTYLEQLTTESDVLDRAPIVRSLTGLLSSEWATDEYGKHLEEKYGKE